MGILLGLVAAVGWGVADFFVAQTSRRIGTLQALFFIQLAGLLAILVISAGQPSFPAASPLVWLAAIALGLLNMACTVLLYRAYAIGTLAIVSPITSGFAVVTALLALATGERPTALALFGAALLVGGVMVVSRSEIPADHAEKASGTSQKLPPGVLSAIAAAVGFGVYFWGIDFVRPVLGAIWPIILSRLCSVVCVILWMLRGRVLPIRLPLRLLPLVLGTAVMDTAAFMGFTFGIGHADTAIVTALASLFSAITVLLAWAITRERLAAYQWAGVGVILAGVLLVSL